LAVEVLPAVALQAAALPEVALQPAALPVAALPALPVLAALVTHMSVTQAMPLGIAHRPLVLEQRLSEGRRSEQRLSARRRGPTIPTTPTAAITLIRLATNVSRILGLTEAADGDYIDQPDDRRWKRRRNEDLRLNITG
jgi:hypothetical protein